MSDEFDSLAGLEVPSDLDDLDDIIGSEGASPEDVKEVSCDLPHWKVDRDDLLQIVQIARSFPIKTALVFGLRLDTSQAKPSLTVHFSNRDSTILATIPVLNDNFFSSAKPYFIEGGTLFALLQNYRNFVLAFDENEAIYFWSNFSQVKLETHNLDWDGLVKPLVFKDLGFNPFPMNREQVNVFKTLFGSALKQSDNTLLITSEFIEAFFTLFIYRLVIKPGQVIDNLVLRKIDLFPISELYSRGGDVFFALHDGMVCFSWPNGYLYFKQIPYQEKNFLYPKTFSSGAVSGEFSLDVALIKKALKLSQYMKASAIDFSGSSGGKPGKIYASPKPGVKFEVGVGELAAEGFTLVCDSLLRLVNTISDREVVVRMVVTEMGIDLIVQNPQNVVEISLSRISSAQYRRDQATEKKITDRNKQIDGLGAKGIVRGTQVPSDGKSFAQDVGVDLDL